MSGTRSLPVRLTDTELLIKAKELSAKVAELDAVEATKKSVAAECKVKYDTLNSDIHHLAKILRTGREDREIEVQEIRNDPARTIEVVRIDTGEVVESRPMTINELQKPLFPEKEEDERELKAGLRAV